MTAFARLRFTARADAIRVLSQPAAFRLLSVSVILRQSQLDYTVYFFLEIFRFTSDHLIGEVTEVRLFSILLIFFSLAIH